MRLKRLELIGFKSFANKIALEFDQGITAIVGPNGSGKSNISDAVRWVLGEQSIKSIRGSKLEDVIFAGSDGKRPLGMAEVQLTLENSDGFLPIDYNEVTITRRVYRSGDSDFLINKRPCRLRDIQDLFTDTGLGREGYAIIGQGQIDAILSSNPEERRTLFEETAGVVKYRQRKERAIKKMEQTDLDLIRIEDILSELNKQLGPLEIEANKARHYQALANQLTETELDLFSLLFHGLSSKKTNLSQQLAENRKVGQELANEYQAVEAQLTSEQGLLSTTEYEMDTLQQQIIELNDSINVTIRNIELTEERQKHLAQQKHGLKLSQTEHEGQINQLETASLAKQKQLEIAKEEYIKAQSKLKRNETKVIDLRESFQEQRGQLEEEKSSFLDFVRELADARNFRRNYQQQRTNIELQIKHFSQEQSEFLAQMQANQLKLKTQEKDLLLARESQTAHSNRLNKDIALIEELNQDIKKTSAEEQRLQTNYQQLLSRIVALKELEDDFEGYNVSVRRLLKKPIPGIDIYGTVGSVIKAPAGLETAIEIALGFGLQNIITPTAQDAKLAIEWLKKQGAGRCTFLPLDSIRANTFPVDYQKYWELPNCLGPAVELVEYDPIYKPAITALLGRIVIVGNLEAALELQNIIPSFNRLVTRNGDVVMPNGSLTGGSINTRTTGLLARKTQIEKLEQQLEQAKRQVEIIVSQKDSKLAELQQAEKSLEQANELDYQLRLKTQKLTNEIEQLKTEGARLEQQYQAKNNQLQELQNVILELEDQSASAQEDIINLENEELTKRQQITELENRLVQLENAIEQANSELTQEKVDLANFQANLKELETQLMAETKQLNSVRQLLAKNMEQQDSLEQQGQQLAIELTTSQKQHQDYLEVKSVTVDKLSKLREQRIVLQGKIKTNNEVLKKLRVSLGKVDKNIYNIEIELRGIMLELQRIMETLDEQQKTLEEIQIREVEREQEELEGAVRELKNRIRDLGVVNLGSLQEYESVKERSFFLQSQLEDVIKAKEALFDVINEMDSVSSERFMATYKQLRTEFKDVFKELFKGGVADIILVNPEDPLNTGIEIIAQPPGKKLQNLTLLSGGERSLTAIALLLSIRRVKPTPFCILDEVDAALDEANLDRFADLLQSFAKSTQFLVITHRQPTMEKADRLYGVTMGESATSQLISVKL